MLDVSNSGPCATNEQGVTVVIMSKATYKGWKLRIELRSMPRLSQTGEAEQVEGVPVVIITDPRGFVWEATAHEGRLSSLTMHPFGSSVIDQKALRNIPLGYIEEAAITAVRKVDTELAPIERDGKTYTNVTPVSEVLEVASLEQGEVVMSHEPPSHEEFARAWRETPDVAFVPGEKGAPLRVTRRMALANRFHKSKYTIDKWTRAAREAGLLEWPAGKTPAQPRQFNKKNGESNNE